MQILGLGFFLGILPLHRKCIEFLAEVTDGDSKKGDHDFTRRRVPAKRLHAQFETVIVNRKINGYYQRITAQLTHAVQVRLRESDVFLQQKTGEQGDRKDDTQSRDMRREGLRKLIIENG